MLVGLFDAKTHLSDLIGRVEAGEDITITRHGVPVARLVSAKSNRGVDIARLGQEMKAARKGRKLGMPVRTLIEEGRR